MITARHRLVWRVCGLSIGAIARPHVAGAQVSDTASVATWRDAVLGGAFIAGTALLLPADRPIQRAAQAGPIQHTRLFGDVADGLDVLADPGTLILAGSTYLVGIVSHHRRVAALGLHVGEALVVAGAITEGLKGIAGRARPFADPTNQYDFRFGRGFAHDQDGSFPSGETTLAFAAASATTAEMARWHPGDAVFVGPLSYALATGVALGRLDKNQHWASDVAMGAGIGTLSGLLVVRWNAAHRRNWIDRVFLPSSVSADGRHGVQMTWHLTQ